MTPDSSSPTGGPVRDTLSIVGVALLCTAALWTVGFGFGREIRLASGEFLGSRTYFGTWLVFVLMLPVCLGIPYLAIRLGRRGRLADHGTGLGDLELGCKLLVGLVPAYVFLPLASASVGTHEYYRYLEEPGFVRPAYVAVHCASYALFAFGYEFLFRGFVLFGLARAFDGHPRGRWIAVVGSTLLSALPLVGLPWAFWGSALLMGVPVGLLTLRLRSFLYAGLIHWNLGVWSDIWEIIKLNTA